MTTQFEKELVAAREQQIKWEKRVRLLEELIGLESEHTPNNAPASQTTPVATPRKRGRPAKAASEATGNGKRMTLPSLLISIGSQHDRLLTIAEIGQLVEQAGYKSSAADPGYMIYQTLYKLCQKGIFERDRQQGAYKFIGAA